MRSIFVVLICTVFSPFTNAVAADAQSLIRIGYSGGGVAKNLHLVIEKAGL